MYTQRHTNTPESSMTCIILTKKCQLLSKIIRPLMTKNCLLLTCLIFNQFPTPSHAEQLTAPPDLSFSLVPQHPCSSACYLPPGSPIDFPPFLFSVLSHRELTPAKHIPRLPAWAVGASNGCRACRRKIKIRGLPLPHPLSSATGSFLTVCVSWMVPVPSRQTGPRFSCHLAASTALFLQAHPLLFISLQPWEPERFPGGANL